MNTETIASRLAATITFERGKPCRKISLQDLPPFAPSPKSLAQRAFEELREDFVRFGHYPNQAMFEALYAVLETLQRMADGTCPPSVYLSSLDPGVGKTQTLICFVKALLSSKEQRHQDVAVLLCVGRLEDVEKMVGAVGLNPEDFAVLTSDETLNALGRPDCQNARVLITTHSMIMRRTKGRTLGEVQELSYEGMRREVVVWDEAMLPGATLTLNRYEVSNLIQPVRKAHSGIGEVIEGIFEELKVCEDGSLFQVPDLTSIGDGLSALTGLLDGDLSEDRKRSLETLLTLSGRTVTVCRDGRSGNTILDYRETLPTDIGPALVLDASGRVRETYRLWEDQRGGLVRLPTATKGYRNLTINLWEAGGGKRSFQQNGPDLLEGIAKTINGRKEEQWLVVHHKKSGGFDPVKGLTKLLNCPENVQFVNWGSHDATNEYAHIQNVVLAGTLFYPGSYHHSLGRASAKRPSAAGPFTSSEASDVKTGEIAHVILQALCRGSVRHCREDQCAPCNAYIIGSKQSGIPGLLPEIFPGCVVAPWVPVTKEPTGRVAEALLYLQARFKADPTDFVPFKEMQTALGYRDASTFRKNIRKHRDFLEQIAAQDIVEDYQGRSGGFRLVSFAAMFPNH